MPRIAHMLRAVLCAPESEGAEMSMGLITGRIVTALAGAMGTLGLALAASPVSSPSDAAHAHWQLVETYCFECHNATDWAGGVAFDTMTVDAVPEDAKVWEAAIKKLKSGLMPPPGSKQPERGAVTSMISWLETTLDNGQATPYVGYVPLRRLNRREYANAIRDLVGLQIDPAAWLPQDPLKDDFDTNAELLQVTPAFMDQAVTAARALALQAVGDPKSVPLETTYGSPANMILSLAAAPATGSGNQQRYKDGMPFGTRGGMSVVHNFPADGEYVLTIGDMALARTVPNMEFRNTVIALLDGKEFWRTDIGGEEDHKAIDQKLDDAVAQINGRLKNIRFYATAGQHTVAVTFLRRSYAEDDGRTLLFQPNDDRRPANPLEGGQHRVHAVHAFQIKGPVKITGMSDSLSRQKIFICKPASPAEERPCAEKIVRNLAERAFRRPVTDEDVVPLMRFYDRTSKTEGFEAGVRESLAAILASPHFLYRAEASVDQGARELNDLELASRLSFFLWSSLPDDELLAVAKRNELSKPDVLAAQVRRMIADPKGISLTRDFGFQWLNVAKLDTIVPSAALFRHASGVYDPREAFKKELELFMDSILRSDRPVTDLLTADHTYLNEQIALIYGMEDVRGNGFHKVKLKDPNRHGLLGKGAVLMLTANPNRTAPVLRGAWIMERILGTPPAVPPPNVPDLNEAVKGKPATVREQTEIHRQAPACASCHAVMDQLGFALENFDTVGAYRTIDPQFRLPIDSRAVMPDGTPLAGPADLHKALAARSDQFAQIITEKLMTYALGRHVDHNDMPTVRRIVREAKAQNYTFESIVMGVVNSDAFRRRAPSPAPALKTASIDTSSIGSSPTGGK
jgi:mono/diheme cytochrome c family protein